MIACSSAHPVGGLELCTPPEAADVLRGEPFSDSWCVLQSKAMELQKTGDLQRRYNSFKTQDLSLSMVSSTPAARLSCICCA